MERVPIIRVTTLSTYDRTMGGKSGDKVVVYKQGVAEYIKTTRNTVAEGDGKPQQIGRNTRIQAYIQGARKVR